MYFTKLFSRKINWHFQQQMNLTKRQWFALATALLIAACFINVLIIVESCPNNVTQIINVLGGTFLGIVIFLALVSLLQIAKCIFCLKAEPIILIILASSVLGITFYLKNNEKCNFNTMWEYTCGASLGMSILNAILSFFF